MCMQCVAKAEVIDPNFLPGYSLMIATENAEVGPEDWPKGHYGIVKINDPTAVFPPIPDPKSSEFRVLYCQLIQQFWFPPEIGHDLMLAAQEVGYVKEEDGFLLGWLMERVYERTAKHKLI